MTFKLKKDLTKPSVKNDMELKAYDVVFVPKTAISEVNQFVDHYIRQLVPVSLSSGFSWTYRWYLPVS